VNRTRAITTFRDAQLCSLMQVFLSLHKVGTNLHIRFLGVRRTVVVNLFCIGTHF